MASVEVRPGNRSNTNQCELGGWIIIPAFSYFGLVLKNARLRCPQCLNFWYIVLASGGTPWRRTSVRRPKSLVGVVVGFSLVKTTSEVRERDGQPHHLHPHFGFPRDLRRSMVFWGELTRGNKHFGVQKNPPCAKPNGNTTRFLSDQRY